MDKDNEIYVTSNGELYKKGVEQAIYPQTNYTTQQFYTKEEYDKLQAEYDNAQVSHSILKTAYFNLQEENERLKNSLEICQGLCETLEIAKANEHNHWFNRCCEINTECDKYRQALQEIRDMATLFHSVNENKDLDCFKNNILAKINEVIGAE